MNRQQLRDEYNLQISDMNEQERNNEETKIIEAIRTSASAIFSNIQPSTLEQNSQENGIKNIPQMPKNYDSSQTQRFQLIPNIKAEDCWISDFNVSEISKKKPPYERKIMHLKSQYLKKQENLEKPRYMQPVRHFKKKLLIAVQEQKKQSQKHEKLFIPSQSKINLQQLYQQKIPIYQKNLEIQKKKSQKVQQSRKKKQQQEMQSTTFKPNINQPKKYMGNFMDRLQKNKKQSQIKAKKVLIKAMVGMTFEPKINQKKMKTSILKKQWNKSQKINQNVEKQDISGSIIQTGSFFSEEISIVKNEFLYDISEQQI